VEPRPTAPGGRDLDESSPAVPPSDLSVAREVALGALLEGAPTAALVFEAETLRILEANAAARRAFDLPADLRSVSVGLSDIVAGFPAATAQAHLRRLRDGLVDQLVVETKARMGDGDATAVEVRVSYSPQPEPCYLGLILELGERSRMDGLVIRRERLRDALAEILRAITRIDNRDDLYRDACRIAVERGGFRMSWIGLVDHASGEVRPVASAGHVEGYLETIHLSVRDSHHGMSANAIRSREPVVVADARTDPLMQQWQGEAEKRGYESAIAVPLVVEGQAIGALMVYAAVPKAFGEIEVELLKNLADDISFKLEVIGRDEARGAAEAERDRLAAVVEQTGESVVITDVDGRIVYTNAAFTHITGYERQEVLGRRPDFLRGESQPAERAAAIRDALLEGRPWAGQSLDRRKDGSQRNMDLVITPRRDESGAIIGTTVIGRDVTRERTLEVQLLQSQKLEAVGRLAGGVAHDFNNLLTAIAGYAEILKSEIDADDPRADDVVEIQRAAARATQLTAQLLAFSRRQILNPRALDPHTVVTGIAPMLKRLLGEDVELVVVARAGLGPILADPGQLDQVLVNLALNARDAMPKGGRLEIEVGQVDLSDESAANHAGRRIGAHVGGEEERRGGTYVVFGIRDAGVGMSPELLERAFEPFFTTKGPGKGTGLGLSTVLGIIEQSDGFIEVESEPGAGTQFRLFLPKTSVSAAETAPTTAHAADMSGSGTLLVVEDEEPVRALLSRILAGAGYTILAAATGEQALDLEAHHGGRIDLLFTDVVLPGMSGRELAEALTSRRPGMLVLYASGYNEEMVAARGVLNPGISYLAKPYTSDEVLHRVRSLLSATRTDP
jgi:PAS domain S-box-containing protein